MPGGIPSASRRYARRLIDRRVGVLSSRSGKAQSHHCQETLDRFNKISSLSCCISTSTYPALVLLLYQIGSLFCLTWPCFASAFVHCLYFFFGNGAVRVRPQWDIIDFVFALFFFKSGVYLERCGYWEGQGEIKPHSLTIDMAKQQPQHPSFYLPAKFYVAVIVSTWLSYTRCNTGTGRICAWAVFTLRQLLVAGPILC